MCLIYKKVVELKLLEAALADITDCHDRGSKVSLEQDLGQRRGIGPLLKLFCTSTKSTSVNLHSAEKQGRVTPLIERQL